MQECASGEVCGIGANVCSGGWAILWSGGLLVGGEGAVRLMWVCVCLLLRGMRGAGVPDALRRCLDLCCACGGVRARGDWDSACGCVWMVWQQVLACGEWVSCIACTRVCAVNT